jgi:uncharacterized Zn finger protein
MAKTMCKKNKEELLKMKGKEKFYKCKSCGATAHKEKHLCKPKKLKHIT